MSKQENASLQCVQFFKEKVNNDEHNYAMLFESIKYEKDTNSLIFNYPDIYVYPTEGEGSKGDTRPSDGSLIQPDLMILNNYGITYYATYYGTCSRRFDLSIENIFCDWIDFEGYPLQVFSIKILLKSLIYRVHNYYAQCSGHIANDNLPFIYKQIDLIDFEKIVFRNDC